MKRLSTIRNILLLCATVLLGSCDLTETYNRENETYNFLKRNVQFSLFFHPIKAKAFNHHLSGN